MLKNLFVSVLILILLAITVFVGLNTFSSQENEINVNGLTRKYRLHLPKNYDANKKYPLVVAFHGMIENPRLFELITGFSREADREDFIVVYPYGTKRGLFSPYSWNAVFCCGTAVENNVDDIAFTSQLIDKLTGELSVDPSEIYLTGFSNGGMFANYAALKLGNKISALAVVGSAVGGMSEEEENFTYFEKSNIPVSVLLIHGRQDQTIPFNGGNSNYDVMQFSGAYDNLNFWLDNNQCVKRPSEVFKNDHSSEEIYDQCAESKEVEFYAIDTGHVWPEGLTDYKNYFSRNSLKVTDLIWQFFSQH